MNTVMEPTLRAHRFAILSAPGACYDCKAPIAVSALLVPAYLQCDEDDGEWVSVDDSAMLGYIEEIDDATRLFWQTRAPQILPAASKTAGLTYLANTCACGALQGDWYLSEPGGPFFPLDDTGIAGIEVCWVEAPLAARAGVSMSSWMDALIALSPYPGWVPASPSKARRRRR